MNTRTATFLLTTLATLLLLGLLPGSVAELAAQRQFPHTFTLDSRSADTLFTPSATSERHRYRVTAWGTYSMWEDTLNSSVDPVWIYSFPEEEWAKPEWRLFPEGYPIYVGDSRMFDSHGLRVDDAPMPQMPLNEEHRYSMVIDGTGEPISVAIVDWNFRGLQKRDAHENNSGFLTVLVEELPLYDADICAIDSSSYPNIRVSVTVTKDSVRTDQIASILSLYENGLPVTIDSIDCGERLRPVSVGLVLDRSGSMGEPWGRRTRLATVQEAAHNFVDRLGTADEAALFTFSTEVTTDQDWTTRMVLMHGAIDRVEARGYTAMNDAVDRAVAEASSRPDRFRRAVVLLSDGEDNISQIRDVSTVAERASAAGIPVFTIGLLYETDDSLRLLARETGGRHFSVADPGSIDSVFASIAELLFEKGCCNVWYTTPRPARDGTWRGVEAIFRVEGDTVGVEEGGYRAPGGASGIGDELSIEQTIRVVRQGEHITVGATLPERSGPATIRLVTLLGETLLGPIPVDLRRGTVALPTAGLPDGVCYLSVTVEHPAGPVHSLHPVHLVR